MQQTPVKLHQGKFIKRYKRFFADVVDTNQQPLTLHCPNTGAMTGLLQEGVDALFTLASEEEMKKRKTPGTLEALRIFSEADQQHYWVGVNTHRANQIALRWLLDEKTQAELKISKVIPEVKLAKLQLKNGELNSLEPFKSRVDFMVERENLPPLLIEVKSATLYENGQGYFPDAVSARASHQLQELMLMNKHGFEVLILYVSQHQAIAEVQTAAHIDPAYAALVKQAQSEGIDVRTLPFDLAWYQ